jgi:hypothetical protein
MSLAISTSETREGNNDVSPIVGTGEDNVVAG